MSVADRNRLHDPRAAARRILLVGVSVAALLAGGGAASARPLNGGSAGGSNRTEAPASPTAAAAKEAAATNKRSAEAVKRGRDSLARATQAIQGMRAAQEAARAAAAARPSAVPNGLTLGGLRPAVTAPRAAALDPSGTGTWQGADLPTEVVKGRRREVTVEQTEQRAILSWETFDIGRDTTLTFDQDGNKDWVVLNRVVGGLDANGRRTAALKPSQILGSIKADGTVLVMNQNGVVFGAGAQVNVNALAVSTAEIGRGMRYIGTPARDGEFDALSLAERNAEFLQNGLLGVRSGLQTDLQREIHSEFTPQYDDVLYQGGGAEPLRDVAREAVAPSGGVFVEAGARITVGTGGFALLNSPRVSNAGEIVAPEGNVSLVAQWGASLIPSDGSGQNGNDANIRGVTGLAPTGKIAPGIFGLDYVDENGVAQSVNADLGEVYGRNTGLIQADRGSIRVTSNEGVLASTTSVSRNGYIAVQRMEAGSVLAILPDAGPETVPQDPLSLANFKTSRVDVGYYVGADALIAAPGGDVAIGPALPPGVNGFGALPGQRILIESGAVIDVGGLRDVVIPASRNAIAIGPLKGNELADNPQYREGFLNGVTLYVDPRRSGVRADGVAWVGSPLVEAESYYQQVGVRADELLTRGGNVRFANLSTSLETRTGELASDTIVRTGAVIDISGGSVRYEGGAVRTSTLIGADGRLYDAADADPLTMSFVGLASGFADAHPTWGVTESYASTLRPERRRELTYDEGRDGGTLDLPGNVVAFDGTIKAGVAVGERQARDAREGTGSSAISWDLRAVQGAPSELPTGGALRIGADAFGGSPDPDATLGEVRIVAAGDMPAAVPDLGYGRDFETIDGAFPTVSTELAGSVSGPRDEAAGLSDDRLRTTYLSADMLSAAGLGHIEIDRDGDVTVAKGATVRLADGGLFTAASGRSIRIDGAIVATSGVVSLETQFTKNPQLPESGLGASALTASPYDVAINGSISVRGRWVNDFEPADGVDQGGAYLDGGAISLLAASRVFRSEGFGGDPTQTRDLSGSVLVNAGATLDLAGGGRIDRDGVVDMSARGGDLALISENAYFSFGSLNPEFNLPSQHVSGFQPFIPDRLVSRVAIDSGATVLSHGFGGGGTFRLTTPEFAFGTGTADVGARLPMGFINAQGFSDYEITSFKTRIVESKFQGARGYDAFLDTQTLTVGAGETLSLRNAVFSLLPSDRSARDLAGLKRLATGGDLYSVLETTTLDDAPGRNNAFYRQPVNLTLGGLIELKVEKGGALIGEAGARLTAPRLINEGLIRLPGGAIVQRELLPLPLADQARATRDPYAGLTPEADGSYLDDTLSADGERTNADAYVGYLLGELPAAVGVALRAGSITDLAGVSLRDPLVREGTRDGEELADGRILAGGTITLTPGANRAPSFLIYPTTPFARFAGRGFGSTFNIKRVSSLTLAAAPGASIDLSGASDVYGRPASGSPLDNRPTVATPVWSDAGGLSAPNGATLSGASIDAHGGDAKARGGALEIADLVLTQGDAARPAANTVSIDLLDRSGFDLVHARGSVTSRGDVDLTLGRGFFLSTRDLFDQTGNGPFSDAPRLSAAIGSGGALSIAAPYVRLEGYAQTVDQPAGGRTGTNSVAFAADQIDVVGAVAFDSSVGAASLTASGDIRLLGQRDVNRRLPGEATGDIVFSDAIGMQLAAAGDLTLTADRIYPETGATALVTSSGARATIAFARPDGPAPATPYSAGASLTVQAANIVQDGAVFVPHGALTLGGAIALTSRDAFGQEVQRAPATQSLTLGAGSLTSVSGGSIRIPYGTTTDLIEYFFAPGGGTALEATPEKRLELGGRDVTLARGAILDVSGGGDLFAYEFVPGTGGSRDVLDRLNPDAFSSNDGRTYPDGRQVYAIVPGLSDATAAAQDPISSAGYEALGAPSAAGLRVYLDGGAGLAAGWYTLLPARYAVLPGGVRVVEQPGGPGLESAATAELPDGTVRVSGRYGQLGSDDWRWRRFDLQTQDVFRSYSNIALTSAQTTFAARAAAAGEAAPRLPRDAGSIALDAVRRLGLDGTVRARAAAGGRGAAVDVGGAAIYVVADPAATPLVDGAVLADGAVVREIDGALRLCADASSACAAGGEDRLSDVAPLLVAADDLSTLGAETLLIGGSRTTRADGAVEIRTTAQRLVVANDAATPLYAPEILLAVGLGQNDLVDFNGQPTTPDDPNGAQITSDVRDGPSKTLLVRDGAVIEARGSVADPSTTDYVAAGGWVGEFVLDGIGFRRSSVGATLRVANGPDRLVKRPDAGLDAFEAATSDPELLAQYERRYRVDLDVGDGARISGTSVLADVGTYRNPTLSVTNPDATDPFGTPIDGGAVGWTPRADLSIGRGTAITADRLTLGAGRIAVTDDAVADGGLAVTRALAAGLGAPGRVGRLNLVSQQAIGFDGGVWRFGDLALTAPGLASRDGGDVRIVAGRFKLGNAAPATTACAGAACGDAALAVDAREIVVGPGAVTTAGFGRAVTLAARDGLFARGVGGLDVGAADLTIETKLIADRAFPAADASLTTLSATALTLASDGAVRILGGTGAAPTAPAGVPGASITIRGASVAVSDARIRATAGVIDIAAATGDVRLSGAAAVETPGFERAFGEVVRAAPGGRLRIEAARGDVTIGRGASVSVGGGRGVAGALALVASEGAVAIDGTLDGLARSGDASLLVDTGGAFDLDVFAATAAARNFDGRIAIRSGTGDLTLDAAGALTGDSVALTADGGTVDLAGSIDTSGVNGGDIALFGRSGVRLRDGARIQARASGYAADDSRRAEGGTVTLGTDGVGAIRLDAGSIIDVGAARAGARLVAFRRDGRTVYRAVAADQGGVVHLRAPVIEQAGADTVNVTANGRVDGAHELVLEAFTRWDLDAIADGGAFTGVTRGPGGGITLDLRDGLDQLAFDARTGAVTVTDAGSGLNVLGDRGAGTVVSFIQDFDVSGAFGALGGLARDENFHARPGVELTARGDVTLASNWNLGAGTVDVTAALADGVMATERVLGRPAVVFGREGALIADYTAMTYRTGARADGEAAVLSLRAGGDLTIRGTVSDGFFQFRNQTDPDFIAQAMAGGVQSYRLSPDLGFSGSFDPALTPDVWTADTAPFGNVVTVDFSLGVTAEDVVRVDRAQTAPYSAEANTVAAIGDDAAGSAELFPLLDGGRAMDAASYRLIAGSDRASADPTRVSAAGDGVLSVEGLNSYVATPLADARVLLPGLTPLSAGYELPRQSIADALAALRGKVAGLDADSFVNILVADQAVLETFGAIAAEVLPADGYSLALADFVTTFDSYLTLPYANLAPFLDAVGAAVSGGGIVDPAALPNPVGAGRTAYYRNLVRTGAGRIDMAAAGNVDLRGGAAPAFVDSEDGLSNTPPTDLGDIRQIGGSAVYTAGRRAAPAPVVATDAAGHRITVDTAPFAPSSSALADSLATYDYDVRGDSGVRGPAGLLAADLSFAEGGGDVSVSAGGDVLGQRDFARSTVTGLDGSVAAEPWRQGQVDQIATVRINPQGFYDGVGALGGGDVRVAAGRDVTGVTTVATASLATAATSGDGVAASRALVTFGGGDVAVSAGRDVLGGRLDVASGEGAVDAGRSIASAGTIRAGQASPVRQTRDLLAVRVADATVDVAAGGAADLDRIAQAFYYAEHAGVALTANGDVVVRNGESSDVAVWPGAFRAVSTAGDLTIGDNVGEGRARGQIVLAPSPLGQLELIAAGDIAPTTIAMSDEDASTRRGVFSSFDPTVQDDQQTVLDFAFPSFLPDLTEGERQLQHAEDPLHAGDPDPVVVAAGRDIAGMILVAAKQARVSAGRDIVDMAFFGQNLAARDVTRITAGRDITATTQLIGAQEPAPEGGTRTGAPLPTLQGNTFRIGGPGAFMLEAGRNAGPFLNSATVRQEDGVRVDYGGGVLSIGNEDNPSLAPEGADVTVLFGVARGVAWNALRDYYLDPANAPNLDDALFEQTQGGAADRTRPIWGPKLIAWMRANEPEALAAEGAADFAAAYDAFKALPELRQRSFLGQVYFDELAATADPDGPSFQQYQRGYRAVNLLFPGELGYTRNDLTGGSNGANAQVATGDLDLRLATIQTSRGGDIRVLGPGGRILAGSVVRTEQQIARRNYEGAKLFAGELIIDRNLSTRPPTPIAGIPSGFEGLLTVRGGAISTFTDGDVLLNQSRLFTQGGGDIAMWSSNGDLNGGEGPKTSSNFPPVVVETDFNAFTVENRRGSATGAGIAAFQPAPGVPAPNVSLIAPRGTVDAGAAGIRVSGNLNIAAQTVANADNISVGGASVGVPTVAAAPVAALTTASNANAAGTEDAGGQAAGGDQASIIIVEVLGYGGGAGGAGGASPDCPPDEPNCTAAP